MNGVHDMGGMHGLGPVAPEADEPVFHHRWEGRVHALTLASPTRGNIDAGRHQRELIPGPRYLAMSYYEKWFSSLKELVLKASLVEESELVSGRSEGVFRGTPRLRAEAVRETLTRPLSYAREVDGAPAFEVGQQVRARNLNPIGHTRLPRYVRGHVGEVVRHHGAHVFPDVHAHGGGEDPQHLYSVRFAARELWGDAGREADGVYLDLWEPYLEPA